MFPVLSWEFIYLAKQQTKEEERYPSHLTPDLYLAQHVYPFCYFHHLLEETLPSAFLYKGFSSSYICLHWTVSVIYWLLSDLSLYAAGYSVLHYLLCSPFIVSSICDSPCFSFYILFYFPLIYWANFLFVLGTNRTWLKLHSKVKIAPSNLQLGFEVFLM